MEKEFKKYYNETLSNFNLDSKQETISAALGIPDGRLDDIQQSFKDYIKNFEEGEQHTRSHIWAGLLYHCEPQSLMEVYALGSILGAFEFSQKVDLEPVQESLSKSMMMTAASYAMSQGVKAAIDNGDYNEAKKFAEEFHELIKKM